MSRVPIIAYLPEPNAEKQAFFAAVCAALGEGRALSTWRMSARGFPETAERAEDCLARAKRQPKSGFGRALKLMFLKGRYNWARRWFAGQEGAVALCWQGLTGTRRAAMLGARDAGAMTLFAELAPLPERRTLDPIGVNAESSVPRERGFYDGVKPDQDMLDGIKAGFVARASRRKDVQQKRGGLEGAGKFLFVPLQVPDDSQMILFAGWCGGVLGFVEALARVSTALPEGWHIRLKEHPSAKAPLGARIAELAAQGARLVLDNDSDSFEQIEASAGVITVNSSMGLQAMFFGKPVIATGEAFWAIEGAAHAAGSEEALRALLAEPERLEFDAAFRARLLTWLARDYYIGFDGQALAAPEQVKRLIGRDGP